MSSREPSPRREEDTDTISDSRASRRLKGSPCEDPESWLEAYDRVSTFKNWDCDEKLRHVYFALEDDASTWFENRGSTLTSRDLFRTGFLKTFTSVFRKERAETLLETRVQLPSENIGLYTEEMTRVFRHADPTMSEEKKEKTRRRRSRNSFWRPPQSKRP